MSLQTPRVLTVDDVVLLRGTNASPAVSAYRAEVAATPAAARAKAQGNRAAKGTEVLRLVNYRRPFQMLGRLAPLQRAQLAQLTRQNRAGKPEKLVEHEDWAPMELVDVLDVASGTVTHQLYIWPWGSGELFVSDTTQRAGAIIQHGFDQEVEDLPFRTALAAAYARAEPPLAETVDFQLDKPRKPTADETETADAKQAAAAYQRLAKSLGESLERYRVFEELSKAQQATIRDVFKTTIVGLITSRHDVGKLGMPPDCRLRSWCGHSPPSELERLAGAWPVWKWLMEARAGGVTEAQAVGAITKAVSRPAFLEIAWMACDPFYDYGFWGDVLQYEGGERLAGATQANMVRLLGRLVDEASWDSAVAFANRVKKEKREPHVWSQALAAIAASALARYANRTSKPIPTVFAPLAKLAGALLTASTAPEAAPATKPAKPTKTTRPKPAKPAKPVKVPKLAKGQFAFLNCRTLDTDAVLALDRTHQEQFMEQIHAYCGVREKTIAKTLEAFLESQGWQPNDFSIELWDVHKGGRKQPRFEYWVQNAGDGTIFDYGTSHSPDSIGSVQHGFESHGSDEPEALALVDALQAAADKTKGL